MQKIVRFLLIIAVVIVGVVWYFHWSRTRALNSGEVFVREDSGDKSRPASTNQPTPTQELADNSSHPQDIAAVPPSDTISRNPPNGVALARPGKFQLYRQGDITWRLNTDTGETCILFATEAQWRKTIVYDHGCARR